MRRRPGLPGAWAARVRCAAPVIRLQDVTLARGTRRLFEHASLQVSPGWRVGVVGANGSGAAR